LRFVLGTKGVGHEIVGVDVLSLLVRVHLASDEVGKLDIIRYPISLEQVDKEVTQGLTPSRKVLDLSLDVLIERLDVRVQLNHLCIQKHEGRPDERFCSSGVNMSLADDELEQERAGWHTSLSSNKLGQMVVVRLRSDQFEKIESERR
jgi:hypothetical protein